MSDEVDGPCRGGHGPFNAALGAVLPIFSRSAAFRAAELPVLDHRLTPALPTPRRLSPTKVSIRFAGNARAAPSPSEAVTKTPRPPQGFAA